MLSSVTNCCVHHACLATTTRKPHCKIPASRKHREAVLLQEHQPTGHYLLLLLLGTCNQDQHTTTSMEAAIQAWSWFPQSYSLSTGLLLNTDILFVLIQGYLK